MELVPTSVKTEQKTEEPPSGQEQVANDQLPKKVAVIYSDARREYFPTEEQYITEKDAESEALYISASLNKLGIEADLILGDESLTENLKKSNPELVINRVDSVKGQEVLCSAIPGVLEMLGVPYVGADILGLSISSSRFLINKLLQQAGIPVPNYQLFDTFNDSIDASLRFPLITKLNSVHGSVEMTRSSIVENEKDLRERLKYLIATYQQPVIVQEFIVGKEISAFILQGVHKKVYLVEKIFENKDQKYNFTDYNYRWKGDKSEISYHYEKYSDDALKELVKKTFDVTNMEDYGKVDIRIDSSNRYYFIDINPNCAFGPKEADAPIGPLLEELYGLSFTEVLRRLILNVLKEDPTDFNGTDL